MAGVTASAPLIRISPFLHPVAHSTEAQIDLANAEGAFKPGMFVTVDVFYGESEEATLVPVSALYENPKTGVMGVYVTRASIDQPALGELGIPESISLTDPLPLFKGRGGRGRCVALQDAICCHVTICIL